MDRLRFGYARVSRATDEAENLENQVARLEREGIRPEMIYKDVQSGGTLNRAGWKELQDRVKPGDSIVVVSLDRFSRSIYEAMGEIESLKARDIGIVSLAESIDTLDDSPAAILMRNLILTIADWFRRDTSRRIREGLEEARASGKHIGRPQATTPAQREYIMQDLTAGYSIRETARRHGVSTPTVNRVAAGYAEREKTGQGNRYWRSLGNGSAADRQESTGH